MAIFASVRIQMAAMEGGRVLGPRILRSELGAITLRCLQWGKEHCTGDKAGRARASESLDLFCRATAPQTAAGCRVWPDAELWEAASRLATVCSTAFLMGAGDLFEVAHGVANYRAACAMTIAMRLQVDIADGWNLWASARAAGPVSPWRAVAGRMIQRGVMSENEANEAMDAAAAAFARELDAWARAGS